MSDEKKEEVSVSLAFDFGTEMITITPTKLNGVALVNPQKVYFTMDQWISVACQLQMRRIKLRQDGLTTSAAPPKLITPL